MAASTGVSGFGITIGYATASGGTYTNLAEVLDVSGPEIDVNSIDLTHNASPSGFKEFIYGLADGGEVSFDVIYGPSSKTTLLGLVRTTKYFKLTYPDNGTSAGSTDVFNGFLTKLGQETPMDDKISNSITIKVNGAITNTPHA